MNPRHRHHYRHRRRNPRTGSMTDDVLMPGLLGAAGGVGLQLIWNALGPSILPCTISGNQILTVAAQGGGALGLGWLAGKALGEDKGDAVAAGALTIVLYNYIASMITTSPMLSGLMRGRRLGAYLPGQGLAPQRSPGRMSLGRLGAYLPGQGLRPRNQPRVSLGAYRPMNPATFLRGPRNGMWGNRR
jgi:hypothetical protein